MASNRSKFEQLLDTWEPRIRDAFLGAISEIKSQIVLRRIIERLERGDVAGAIDALQIDPEVFGRLEIEIANAYNAGGIDMASGLVLRDSNGSRIAFRFGVRNPEAEAWLRDHSSTLVTRIVEDQRTAIRQALVTGLELGNNPRTTAIDIVGRVSKASGARTGGIIGLTAEQERHWQSVRAILSDPERIREFFILDRETGKWKPRYKLTPRIADRSILKAIREGRALDSATIERLSTMHSNRMLKYRGDVIGLNETFNALGKSRDDAIMQAVRSGKVDAIYVRKIWRHSGKDHARWQHKRLNGHPVGLLEDFEMADGTRMPFPHAPGAPIEHTASCGCFAEYKIDYTAQLIERRSAA